MRKRAPRPKRPKAHGSMLWGRRTAAGEIGGRLVDVGIRVLAGGGLEVFDEARWQELRAHLKRVRDRSLSHVAKRWEIPVPPATRPVSVRSVLVPNLDAARKARRTPERWQFLLLCAFHLLVEEAERTAKSRGHAS